MSERKKILHVGCGAKRENALPEEFQGAEYQEIRLDLDPSVKPDYVSDICDMKEVATGSMAGLWSSHNIEHLYPHDVPRALAEFHRVLNEGGRLHIALPDMQRVAQFVALGALEEPLYVSPAGPISAIDMMYGHRAAMAAGNLFMAHKTAFTMNTLAAALLNANFSDVYITRQHFDLYAIAEKRQVLSQPRTGFRWTDRGGPMPVPSVAA